MDFDKLVVKVEVKKLFKRNLEIHYLASTRALNFRELAILEPNIEELVVLEPHIKVANIEATDIIAKDRKELATNKLELEVYSIAKAIDIG